MTRRFLDDVRTDIVNLMAQPTPLTKTQVIASLAKDILDSCVQDECYIRSTAPTLGVAVTDSWTKVNSTTYDVELGGDGSFLIPSFANGEITTSAIAGFSYIIAANVTFTGTNNTRYFFSALENGVPIGGIDSHLISGNSSPVSSLILTRELSAPANAVFALGIMSDKAVDTIDIVAVDFSVEIVPTNNP